jgi:hypothetical protein
MQSRRRLLNWLIFVATTHLKIVVADMALVTQEGWIISAQGFAPLTIRNYHKNIGPNALTVRNFCILFLSLMIDRLTYHQYYYF